MSRILEAPFPNRLMRLPYPAPPHWRRYRAMFDCPVQFGQPVMEWRFDAAVLERPARRPIRSRRECANGCAIGSSQTAPAAQIWSAGFVPSA